MENLLVCNFSPILSYLDFKKKKNPEKYTELLNLRFFSKIPLIFKNKSLLFHSKINLVSEIVLYSMDSINNRIQSYQKNYLYEKILKEKNFCKIQRLGTGSCLYLFFGILAKTWICFNGYFSKGCKKKGLLIAFSSREDKHQLISIFCSISNIFNFIIFTDTNKSFLNVKNKYFKTQIMLMNFTSILINHSLLKSNASIVLRGNFLVQEFYLSLIKFKNLSSYRTKSIQKILIFNKQVIEKIFFGRKKVIFYSNKMKTIESTYFLGNQILDISETSFVKIRRILENIIKLDKPKIIKSYSFGRSLILLDLLIKTVRKYKIKYKSIEILKIKKLSFFVFIFHTSTNYFTCNLLKKKKFRNISFIIFHDISQNHKIFIDQLEFTKTLDMINLNIFFFVRTNRTFFFQIMKCYLLEKNAQQFYIIN